jgi:hypothetical protein
MTLPPRLVIDAQNLGRSLHLFGLVIGRRTMHAMQ